MTTAIVALAILLTGFTAIGLWARPKKQVMVCEVPAYLAPVLAEVLAEYAAKGGRFEDVIGYGVNAHPSGWHHVYLVTQADVVAEAEAVLREAA